MCFHLLRSIPDEQTKGHVTLEPCPQTTDLGPSVEIPKSDAHKHPPGSTPPSEPRKRGVRERRRDGRSKTFDWAEFKMERKEKPTKERADTVDLSSSFSTASSCYSPSSSPSSLASSPVSSSSLQTSSVSGPQPHNVKEEAEKENVRRGNLLHNTSSAGLMPKTVSVISTVNTAPLVPDSQEQGQMEVDHPAAVCLNSEDATDGVTSDVQEEIEQRWHQVETTPLREEKQVPIVRTLGDSERLPAQELAALLDKEVCLHSGVSYIHC